MLCETCPVNLNIRPKGPCSGKSVNNWESPATPQGTASLIPRTPYLMCIKVYVSSLITHLALPHALDPFPDILPLTSVGFWALAWLPGFSEYGISGSLQLGRSDKNVRVLFFLLHVCSSNCTRLCYLDSYSRKRHHHSFSFLHLFRGKGKK